MNKTNPVLKRLQEVYRVDQIFLKILQKQVRHSDDLMFMNSCIKNLIDETRKQAVASKQYIDHIRGSVSLQPKQTDWNLT